MFPTAFDKIDWNELIISFWNQPVCSKVNKWFCFINWYYSSLLNFEAAFLLDLLYCIWNRFFLKQCNFKLSFYFYLFLKVFISNKKNVVLQNTTSHSCFNCKKLTLKMTCWPTIYFEKKIISLKKIILLHSQIRFQLRRKRKKVFQMFPFHILPTK